MRETKKKSQIVAELNKKHNCFAFCLTGSYYQINGLPDVQILKDSISIFVECKGPDTKTEPVQVQMHKRIRRNGGFAFFLTFVEDHRWILNDGDFGYEIRFRVFPEGVKLLIDTLMRICSPQTLTTQEIFK